MTIPLEKNNFNNFPPYASQLASENHAIAHLNNLLISKIIVKTTTLNEIIREYEINYIDLLHTDTEGHDYVIIMNYNFDVKPKKIMFEHKHMDRIFKVGIKYTELSNRLLSLGYKKISQNTEDSVFELLLYYYYRIIILL
jgi:hypothetical protein